MSALSDSTILLVDDDDSFRASFGDVLRLDGARVIEAAGGELVLTVLDRLSKRGEAPPDLVVLDLMMPRVSGIEVLQRLRRSRWGSVPVLVVTAVNDPMLSARLDLPTAFKTDAPAVLLAAVRRRLGPRRGTVLVDQP